MRTSLLALVVEDEAVQALALRQTLEELGHEVTALAPDGPAAVESFRRQRPDVVLMDIRLPGLDGIDIAARLMEIEPKPVILLTAQVMDADRERARRAGVFSYLVKPIGREALDAALETAYLHFHNVSSLEREVEELQETLRLRKLTERAKGVLIDQLGMSPEQAGRHLQLEAERKGVSVEHIAKALLEAGRVWRGQD